MAAHSFNWNFGMLIVLIARRLLRGKVARNLFSCSWHLSGKHLACGIFERHVSTLILPKKFPSKKPEKTRYRETDYLQPFVKLYFSRNNVKFRIQQCQRWLAKSERAQKLDIRILNGFSFRRIVFELYTLSNTNFQANAKFFARFCLLKIEIKKYIYKVNLNNLTVDICI